MRIAAVWFPVLLSVLGGCATSNPQPVRDSFDEPNALIGEEIEQRVKQIPFQHRDELLQNLTWLSQAGEQVLPAMVRALQHENPKVRSSAAWVMGQVRDRRVIPYLQAAAKEEHDVVRLECARTLVLLGDLAWSPQLIEGLDSDRREVRYLCHEVLKTATGRDFGFDHLSENLDQRRMAVFGWRQWWSDYSGDVQFARAYQQQHGITGQPATGMPAAPAGEVQLVPTPTPDGMQGNEGVIEVPAANSGGNGENPAASRRNGDGR